MTAGEGGAILTNDEQFEHLCWSLQTCGRLPEGEWYEHHLPGGNYRMTEFQAGLLLNQLTRLEQQTRTRERNGRYLNHILADVPGISPLKRGLGVTRHSYHLYIFRFKSSEFDGLPRARFLEALTAEGIPNLAGYGAPLHRQELFMKRAFGPYTGYQHSHPDLDYAQVHSPVSERACKEEACWLPQSVMLGSETDMDDIAHAMTKIYENRGELL
jgi:dTDP-4-amino-4,6-dideoxygalactose transaminase